VRGSKSSERLGRVPLSLRYRRLNCATLGVVGVKWPGASTNLEVANREEAYLK